jgi:hypothetical protein
MIIVGIVLGEDGFDDDDDGGGVLISFNSL